MWIWAVHHRLWAAGIGVVALIVVVAGALWFLVVRSPATPLNLRQALRLYRRDGGSSLAAAGPYLPPPGVYVYRTTGAEQLSPVGANRSFPGDTEVIVTDATCATVTWEPLVQHVEGLVECPGASGSLRIASARSYEQIAGTRATSIVRCPSSAYLIPPNPSTGLRWQAACHSGTQHIEESGTVVGLATVAVGRRVLPALHIRIAFDYSGAQQGTNPTDYWISPDSGLILRQLESVDVVQRSGPLGSVRYTERMAITLEAVSPVR